MMPKMLYRNILCALVMVPAMAGAQAYSFVNDIRVRRLPAASDLRNAYRDNPDAMWYCDTLSLAHFTIEADYLGMDEPVMEQLGDGHLDFGVKAGAYKRLDSSGVAWGQAGFTSATIRNVRWTDCIDYDYIAPYTLGDGKGGDMESRRYELSGGYSLKTGAWTVGAHLSYRAEIAYRDIDPRVKTVVSDLQATIGAGYSVGSRLTAGVTAGVTRYDQNCDVEFYNPINDINTYPLTGLGSWYSRFMGNTNKSSGHESFGWNVGLHLLTTDPYGGGIEIRYEGYRMDQRLRSYNNIIPGYTDNNILKVRACHSFLPGECLVIVPVLSWNIFRREGTENLFGPASGNSYDRIGSRKAYMHRRMTARAVCHLQLTTGAGSFTFTPGVAYLTDSERIIDPYRRVYAAKAGGSLGIDYSKASGKWLWQASLAGDCFRVMDKEASFTGLDLQTSLGQCVENNYLMLSAGSMSGSARVGVARLYGSVLLGINAGMRHVRHDGCGCGNQIFASISTIF